MDRVILLDAPQELNLPAGKVLRCKVNAYGTNDAPVAFYRSIRRDLLKRGCRPLRGDPCVFTWHWVNP